MNTLINSGPRQQGLPQHCSSTCWTLGPRLKALLIGGLSLLSSSLIPRVSTHFNTPMKTPAQSANLLEGAPLFGIDGFQPCGRYADVSALYDVLGEKYQRALSATEHDKQMIGNVFVDKGACESEDPTEATDLWDSGFASSIYFGNQFLFSLAQQKSLPIWHYVSSSIFLQMSMTELWSHYSSTGAELTKVFNELSLAFNQYIELRSRSYNLDTSDDMGYLHRSMLDLKHAASQFMQDVYRDHERDNGYAEGLARSFPRLDSTESESVDIETAILLLGLTVPLIPLSLNNKIASTVFGLCVAIAGLIISDAYSDYSGTLLSDDETQRLRDDMEQVVVKGGRLFEKSELMTQSVTLFSHRDNRVAGLGLVRESAVKEQLLNILKDWQTQGNLTDVTDRLMSLSSVPGPMNANWAFLQDSGSLYRAYVSFAKKIVHTVDAQRYLAEILQYTTAVVIAITAGASVQQLSKNL